MATAKFWVYVEGGLLLTPMIKKSDLLFELLETLRDGGNYDSLGINPMTCTLYKLRTPLARRGEVQERARACLEARNDWIKIDNAASIEELASSEHLCKSYVCLVIETAKGQHDRAISDLKTYNEALFQSLRIYLRSLTSWTKEDVVYNLSGGVFLSWEQRNDATGQRVAPEQAVIDVEESLARRRTFIPEQFAAYPNDLALTSQYPSEFKRYFEERGRATRRSDNVQNSREFVAHHYLLRCHQPDAARVATDPSSHFKANQLSSYFLVPPFFSCREENSKTLFKTELPWKFPIFIATRDERSKVCKFTPCSDFSVCAKDFLCPFFLCEVISERKETDRYRMLVQGIAAVRALNTLKKPGSKMDLFVVAVYLRADLTAERYIIMQTPSPRTSTPNASSELPKVSITQTDYDLKDSNEAADFMRVMFNLQDNMDELIERLDENRKNALSGISKYAHPLSYLTQSQTANKKTEERTQGRALDGVPEENQPRGQRHAGQFTFADNLEIQGHLAEMGYEILMIPDGVDNVAMVASKSDPSERGFLKFTTELREANISRYLSSISSLDNHTIHGLQVWDLRSGGFVIYSASGGSHLVDITTPDVHMWSAAKQLVEGVACMHRHGVAHLDIKPGNILFHLNGGRLSIIDFGISEFVSPDEMIRGTRGTDNYMAPEVLAKNVDYDPIRADLWSTGKTLQDLTSRCRPSREKEFLVDITRQLTAEEPSERPMMSEVLGWMASFRSSPVLRQEMKLPFPMIASETPA